LIREKGNKKLAGARNSRQLFGILLLDCTRLQLQHHGFNAKITKKPLRAVSASVMKKIRSLPLCSLSGFNTHKLKPIDEQEEELI
ncbi:hypothetical protein X975_08989, partial [Stegodyphus mimosarum]